MRKITPWPKYQQLIKNWQNTLLFLTFAIGALLHLRNYNGAVCLYADEVRAFTLMPSGPLIYLLCRPIFDTFKTMSSVYYFAGLLGISSIALFYLLSKSLFTKKTAVYATIIYAFFPFRIYYARILYPALFIDFFMLLLIFSLITALKKGKKYLIAFPGIISALLIYVHPSTYALLAGLNICLAYLWYTERRNFPLSKAVVLLIIYLATATAGFFILQLIFMKIQPGYVYWEKLFGFHQEVLAGIERDGNHLAALLNSFRNRMFNSPMNTLRSLISITAIGLTLLYAFRKKQKIIIASGLWVLSGTGIFFTMANLGMHEAHFRHFVWIMPVLSIYISSAVYFTTQQPHLIKTSIVYICLTAFILTSLTKSFQLTIESFRTDKITNWLAENNIAKKDILTLPPLTLHSPGDKSSTSMIPCRAKEHWHSLYPKKQEIFWELVLLAFKQGKCKYIMPSGVGSLAYLGEDDSMLENVEPIKKWLHPYWEFKYRFKNDTSHPIYIKLYSLDDIFSEKNLKSAAADKNRPFDGKNWQRIRLYSVGHDEKERIKLMILKALYAPSILNNNPIIALPEKGYIDLNEYIPIIDRFYEQEENRKIPIHFCLKIADLIKNNQPDSTIEQYRQSVIEMLKQKGLIQ